VPFAHHYAEMLIEQCLLITGVGNPAEFGDCFDWSVGVFEAVEVG